MKALRFTEGEIKIESAARTAGRPHGGIGAISGAGERGTLKILLDPSKSASK